MVRAPSLLPFRVQLHELRTERVAPVERHGGAADGEVVRGEPARFREVALRGVGVAVPAGLGGNPEVQAGPDLVVGEVADGPARRRP